VTVLTEEQFMTMLQLSAGEITKISAGNDMEFTVLPENGGNKNFDEGDARPAEQNLF